MEPRKDLASMDIFCMLLLVFSSFFWMSEKAPAVIIAVASIVRTTCEFRCRCFLASIAGDCVDRFSLFATPFFLSVMLAMVHLLSN